MGVVIVALLLSIVVVRLVWLQALGGDRYAAAAATARDREVTLHAARGTITDRNGVRLAYTADAKDIVADPTLVPTAQRESYAATLSVLLGQPYGTLLSQLGSGKRYAKLASAVTPALAKQVTGLTMQGKPAIGLYAEATEQRMYPTGTTAATVVGDVHTDGTGGAAGIEYSMNSALSGTDGSESYQIDSVGNVNPAASVTRKAAVNGATVRLSIDSDLQFTVQKYLNQSVTSSGARTGQVIVLDRKTAQVLAMASAAAPGAPAQSDDPNVQQVFEPGSANKIVTMAAAVDQHLIGPMSTLDVPDTIAIGGVTVRDAWWHPTQKFTATGVLAESSNVGTLMIAQRVGAKTFDDYLLKFGLGQQTGVELPGESAGLLPSLANWSSSTFANLPIGQGVAMTSLQLASMYQTVANDGVRIPPRIVSGVVGSDGVAKPGAQPAGVTVMSPATAKTVRTMLESVTLKGGTGTKAVVPGYRVAGKTGTAQQPDPTTGRYSNSVYWDTFAGMAPADDPRFVVAIMIDNPAHGLEGGDVAAPLFHHIAAYELSATEVAPSGSQSTLVPLTVG